MKSQRSRVYLITAAGGLALIGAVLLATLMRPADQAPATLTPSQSPSAALVTATPTAPPSPTATASPTASPLPAATFENRLLGYRVALPDGYRRGIAYIFTGQQALGVDVYTMVTEEAQREACMRDAGHIPAQLPPGQGPEIRVGVVRNDRAMSAREWATTPQAPGGQPLSTHNKVETVTINGRDAVRLVADNADAVTNAFVIRANDRIYELYPTMSHAFSRTWLDEIAKTFVVFDPAPFPSPTATTPPRAAAQQTADALARAFAARDADAVARLMPDCWFAIVYAIDGTVPGQGPLNRSVHLFIPSLRDRFAAGDLTVSIDPTIQVRTDAGGDHFYFRSEWKDPGRTRRVDLFIEQRIDRWTWSSAVLHFTSAEAGRGCVSYGTPWVTSTSGC